MTAQGLIFDFNGTMFFDSPFQERSWTEYLTGAIGREVTMEELMQYMHGRHVAETFSYFFGRPVENDEAFALGAQVEQIYRRMCLQAGEDFCLAPGLVHLLDEVKEKGIPCTIATASSRGNVEFFFENLGLSRWFDLERVMFNDGSFPGKPAPDIFLKAAQKLGVQASQCVIFEDALSGLQAARSAGVGKVVAIASTMPRQQLQPLADVILDDYRQISLEELLQLGE